MIQAIAFYFFATIVVASAVMVVMARNPVHSVLWLIMAFFNAAGLMVLVGAEFIAMLLVIVYVGAVAVLFLFVVMMLDIDFAAMRAGFSRNAPLGLVISELITNSLKYGKGTVEVSVRGQGDHALITVTDEGDGFPESYPKPTGTGLGMRLVKSYSGYGSLAITVAQNGME